MQTLTKNWRQESAAWRKHPKVERLETFGDSTVILRPMSALRQTEIDKRFPADKFDGRLYGIAIIADSVCSGEVSDTGEVLGIGEPIWSYEDLLSEDVGAQLFRELSDKVSAYLVPKRDQSKNSTPVSDSPIV